MLGHDLKLLIPAAMNNIYLNSGTLGPSPTTALAASTAGELEWSEYGPGQEVLYRRAREKARSFARRIESFFSDGVVSLTENAAQGVLAVLWGLEFFPGDEIITSDHENPDLLRGLSMVARRYSLTIRVISLDASEGFLNQIRRSLSVKTRLVAISHVSWLTGWQFPVDMVADVLTGYPRCRLLADGSQALGNIVVDPGKMGVDFYVFSGDKWMLAPVGWAGLWVRRERMVDLHSIWSTEEAAVNPRSLEAQPFSPRVDTGEGLEYGSRCWPRVSGWAITWDYFEEEGFDRHADYQLELANKARRALAKMSGLSVLRSPELSLKETALMAISDQRLGRLLGKQLAEKHVVVKPLDGYHGIRLSWAAFNTEEDVEQLIEAIQSL